MKKTLLLLFCAALFSWLSYAQTPLSVYTSTSLPTKQGWTELKLDASVNSTAAPTTLVAESDVLNLTSTNAVDQFSQLAWYKTGLDLNMNTGFTIEIKAKVISADKTSAFNIQGFDKNGKGFRVGILADKVTENTDPFTATRIIKDGLVNGDAYHVYTFLFPPTGEVAVYRDGVSIGTFPITNFQYDNIVENGGFEDAEFPDFRSSGIMTRINKADSPEKVRNGNYSLELFNNGMVNGDFPNHENARSRAIAVKPGKEYQSFMTRRLTKGEPYSWRDIGIFYDTQLGTLGGVDDRNNRVTFGSANDRVWQIHPQDFTTPADVKSVRFEFPTFQRDGSNEEVTTSLDNMTIREKPPVAVGLQHETAKGFPAPVFPEGFVNIIKNAGFEDHTINNDGSSYTWALASEDPNENSNNPVKFNSMWNGDVRIQDRNKPDDFNAGDEPYAHSGTNALRFSSLQSKERNFDFTVELEANKTYRFNFWHRGPKWDDAGWIRVKVGDNIIWGMESRGRNNVWANCDLYFTTTDANKTLHLYLTGTDRGDWFNVYFDDFVLYEVASDADPVIAGKTNLIANGNFEDATLGNDGQPYTWALASTNPDDDANYPVGWSNFWGSVVRLQDQQKRTDTGLKWAHSGTKSLRFSYLDNWDHAQAFEGVTDAYQPVAYKANMNLVKVLEPNKTYTFVFWLKTANYPDRGRLVIANDNYIIWEQEMTTKYVNWTRQEITFSTTAANHTLRMFTEFGGWFNFYLDDLFLFENDTYRPELAPTGTSETFLQFGKSTGTSSADVSIQYVNVDVTGAFAPTGTRTKNIQTESNVRVFSKNSELVVEAMTPVVIYVYNTIGVLVDNAKVDNTRVFNLPAGSYIIKAVAENGKTQSVKAMIR